MKMNYNSKKAFTLIELVVVIVILGIIASIAVPRFYNLQVQAKRSTTSAILGSVRQTIQAFSYARFVETGNRNIFPSLTVLDTDTEILEFGNGKFPENPYNNSVSVRDADNEWNENAVGNPPIDGDEGWAYDSVAGKIWANTDEAGEKDL